ncbi:sensor histidine kinase [Winogradskyella wichelsiae]|uniref:sensor histidine kinase n=1 Tax=Winogradskyella wichelsiae TaxID=2697007 RepID=UPI003EF886BB
MLKKLWSSYHQWYITYSRFSRESGQDELSYFRDKLFVSILILILPLGLMSYVPSAITAIILDKWYVFCVDTVAISVIAFLFFNNKMSLQTKKKVFSVNLFLLGFALILYIGLKSSSGLILFMLSILVTLFSGRKAGIKTVVFIGVAYLTIIVIFYFKLFDLKVFTGERLEVLIIICVNNTLFILMTVFSVSFLIRHLYDALLKENHLQKELVEKHKNVIMAKEKAEETDKLKTAFLANMSHEIRTPMYGILGCADLLKSYNVEDEDFKEYISIIENNGQELLNAMTDIMNISKIETGLMSTNKSTFNISETVASIHQLFLPEAKSKKVQFVLNNFIPKKECYVDSDLDKFKVALMHLVENAIKYTPEGGHISLSCHLDSVKPQIQFMLRDTGIGIPEDKIETIFNPFYQVDVANKNALHGSGIGLSISKAYIEMLGDNLIIESKEGEGTSFLFNIDIDLNEKAPQS